MTPTDPKTDFHHSVFLDFSFHCNILNVSADEATSLFQVFLLELREPTRNFEPHSLFNPRGKGVVYSNSVNPKQVQGLSIPAILLAVMTEPANDSHL